MNNLDGMARYFSSGGLLLETIDRFGNSIRYFYETSNGQSAESATTPTSGAGREDRRFVGQPDDVHLLRWR